MATLFSSLPLARRFEPLDNNHFKMRAAFFTIAKNVETVRPYYDQVTRLRCFCDAARDRRSDDRWGTLGQYAAGFAYKGIPIVGWRVWADIPKAHAGWAGAVKISSIVLAGQRNEGPILRWTPAFKLGRHGDLQRHVTAGTGRMGHSRQRYQRESDRSEHRGTEREQIGHQRQSRSAARHLPSSCASDRRNWGGASLADPWANAPVSAVARAAS